MSESRYKLREKTVVLAGPFSPILQSMANHYIELGADVAVVAHKDFNSVQRFLSNLLDLREVHSEYGRCAAVDIDIQSVDSAKEALTRSAELFGSVDIYVDTHLLDREEIQEKGDQNDAYKKVDFICQAAQEFLSQRRRGKIVCVSDHQFILDSFLNSDAKKQFAGLESIKNKVIEGFRSVDLNFNWLNLGITEEFLLHARPEKGSIAAALKEIQIEHPNVKLLNPVDVNNLIIFLSSPLSTAIDNQEISLTQVED